MNRYPQRIRRQSQSGARPPAKAGRSSADFVFITGTGTGVGKTVLTTCLVRYCRQRGWWVRGLKPLCSGGRGDVRALQRAMSNRVSQREICYHSFAEPLAPMVAARRAHNALRLECVLGWISGVCARSQLVVIEGAGGLLSPLGEDFDAPELIRALGARTVLVASNRLGMLNEVFLAERVLREEGLDCACVVSMQPARGTAVSRTNPGILRNRLAHVPVLNFPYLGRVLPTLEYLDHCVKKSKKTLAGVLDCVNLPAPSARQRARA